MRFRSSPRKFECQRQRCSAMTVVSGNITFLGDEASNDSGVIENVDFQGFGTLNSTAFLSDVATLQCTKLDNRSLYNRALTLLGIIAA